jgi:pyrroline-5-carboxylate reductase
VNIGFIGGGNIAAAIISGLRAAADPCVIRVTERPNAEKLKTLEKQYGVIPAELGELIRLSDVVLLAVKPKDVQALLAQLRELPRQGKLFISVAAGIPLSALEKYLPETAVVRVMPNTACMVRQSMSGLVRGAQVSDQQAAAASQIFNAVGKTLWTQEEKMNAVTAVSGSGPAYYYLFTEYLIQAGVHLGLTEGEAETLARETISGAAKMLAESGKPVSQLRQEVTSPNGTTYEALKVFQENGLADLVDQAAAACARRGEEMLAEYVK